MTPTLIRPLRREESATSLVVEGSWHPILIILSVPWAPHKPSGSLSSFHPWVWLSLLEILLSFTTQNTKSLGRPDQEGDFPHPLSISPSLTPTVLPRFHSPFLDRSNQLPTVRQTQGPQSQVSEQGLIEESGCFHRFPNRSPSVAQI